MTHPKSRSKHWFIASQDNTCAIAGTTLHLAPTHKKSTTPGIDNNLGKLIRRYSVIKHHIGIVSLPWRENALAPNNITQDQSSTTSEYLGGMIHSNETTQYQLPMNTLAREHADTPWYYTISAISVLVFTIYLGRVICRHSVGVGGSLAINDATLGGEGSDHLRGSNY